MKSIGLWKVGRCFWRPKFARLPKLHTWICISHLNNRKMKSPSIFMNPICLLNTCPNAPLWPFRLDSWINFSKQQRLVMFVSAAATPPPRWRVSRQTLRHADMSPSTGVKFFNEVGCVVGDWNTVTIMLRMMSSFISIISRTSRISTSAIFLHTHFAYDSSSHFPASAFDAPWDCFLSHSLSVEDIKPEAPAFHNIHKFA